MDTYRGNFIDHTGPDLDTGDDDYAREAPPAVIGQDERRMQVRAYNLWAGQLDNRNFPSIEDLEPEALPDFGPYSVLLDFSTGIENPAILFLGAALAEECGASTRIATLADVPSRSLLSRITDHYMQILANQAPIGFEAEFVNQREKTILYRGILLPYSSDDDTIDFIYGVINWKELADQRTTDALLLEIDQALYAAIGRAYDFSLAAAAQPAEFAELVADSGLVIQPRAPMTPVVKLVFGADYDKTRLTEYAAALGHAHRLGLGQGELARHLAGAPGGLKGVVGEERRLKRAAAGKTATPRTAPREELARKLRAIAARPLADVTSSGEEFALLVARRLASGEVVLLGEVAGDTGLLERAARQLVG